MARKTVECKACNGTGQSRYREYDDCDVCDGTGAVTTYSDPIPVGLDPNRRGAFGAAITFDKEAAANAEP